MLNLILSRRGCSQLLRETTQEFAACRPTKPQEEEVAKMRKFTCCLAVLFLQKLQELMTWFAADRFLCGSGGGVCVCVSAIAQYTYTYGSPTSHNCCYVQAEQFTISLWLSAILHTVCHDISHCSVRDHWANIPRYKFASDWCNFNVRHHIEGLNVRVRRRFGCCVSVSEAQIAVWMG